MSQAVLDTLLERGTIRRGSRGAVGETLPTGFATLDAATGGGWPFGALAECLVAQTGSGAMRLCLSALARVTRAHGAALINPPYEPYAPALLQAGLNLDRLLVLRPDAAADQLWAAVRCLQDEACRMTLFWITRIDDKSLRRLQLAAEEGRACAVLFRPLEQQVKPSPATLRLAVRPEPNGGGLGVDVFKCHGRAPQRVRLSAPRVA